MTKTEDRAWTLSRSAVKMIKAAVRKHATCAEALAVAIDRCAESYVRQDRLYGAKPTRRLLRAELQRLRQATTLSNHAKDYLLWASWKRMAEIPQNAVCGKDGSSLWSPESLLKEIDAYAAQVERWIDEGPAPTGGRPPAIWARKLIRDMAKVYTKHTGRRATASPAAPFASVVCCVFESLGLPNTDQRKIITAALADSSGKTDSTTW